MRTIFVINRKIHKILDMKAMNTSTGGNSKSRLMRDLSKLEKEEDDSIFASPLENNIYQWEAVILGPEGTAWEGGIFKLDLKFEDSYPSKAPKIQFISKMFHPNIYHDGRICLDILDKSWSPVYDVHSILISIRSLLSDPNEMSPANVEAAQLYKSNPQLYELKVKECVKISIDEESKDNES